MNPFTKAWKPVLDAQAIARNAAGWPPATMREKIACCTTFHKLRLMQDRDEIPDVVEVIGLEQARDPVEEGGVIIAFPHTGPFASAASLLAFEYPNKEVFVVGDDIGPKSVPVSLFNRYGWDYLSVHDDAIAGVAVETLQRGGALLVSSDVMIPDQHWAKTDFLDHKVKLPTGPAFLSMTLGAPILPVASYLEGKGSRVLILPPIYQWASDTYRSLTQRLANAIGSLICEEPDQWFPPYPLSLLPEVEVPTEQKDQTSHSLG